MQAQEQRGMSAGAAPGPDEDLAAVYVAYHDWEHYSSIRNLMGVPNVLERPPPDKKRHHRRHPGPRQRPPMNSPESLNEDERHDVRSLPPPSTTTHSTEGSSTPSSPMLHETKSASANARSRVTRRNPKRSFDVMNRRRGRIWVVIWEDRVEEVEGGGGGGRREGDDDERAEKEVSATLLPPDLTASPPTEDNDEEDDDFEDDGTGAPDSTSTSRSASLSPPSLSKRQQKTLHCPP
ncbi:hypothetical protein FRC04_005122 [Tulasnella sp. 424]|nr:hypothetical protein FRC04_005122 [Tulasnella sp. 424]